MSQRNAFSYIQELGVENGMLALRGPASLPFTVDVLTPTDVPREVYEAFGTLHTLTPGNQAADDAYKMLGRTVFPTAKEGEGRPLDLAGEANLKILLAQYHRLGNLVIFLSNHDTSVAHGLRPGLGRNRWDVGGPFQISVAQHGNTQSLVWQATSRSESLDEATASLQWANYPRQHHFRAIIFPPSKT